MISNARNHTLMIGDTEIEYITFGIGKKNLVIIPGVGDGLKNVKGLAVPMALQYKAYARDYSVYIFSRKNHLKEGCTTQDMAFDLKVAMEILGIKKADMMGISQGGMVAQHFALKYPDKVGRLVLAVTLSRCTDYLKESVGRWLELAEQNDFRELLRDHTYRMYTEDFVEKNKWLLPAVSSFGKPESFEKFIIMAKACLQHDCHEKLADIKVPVLAIGGELDIVVGAQATIDIAEQIPNCELCMIPDYGHAVYMQSKEFHQRVMQFLTKEV